MPDVSISKFGSPAACWEVNYTNRQWPAAGAGGLGKGMPDTSKKDDPFQLGFGDGWQAYYSSGFLGLQYAVESYVLGAHAGSESVVDVGYTAMPAPAYVEDQFTTLVLGQGFSQFLFICFFMVGVGQLSSFIVLEKENKLREGFLMMGCSPSAYTLHWWLTYAIIYLVMAVAVTIILKIIYNYKAH